MINISEWIRLNTDEGYYKAPITNVIYYLSTDEVIETTNYDKVSVNGKTIIIETYEDYNMVTHYIDSEQVYHMKITNHDP